MKVFLAATSNILLIAGWTVWNHRKLGQGQKSNLPQRQTVSLWVTRYSGTVSDDFKVLSNAPKITCNDGNSSIRICTLEIKISTAPHSTCRDETFLSWVRVMSLQLTVSPWPPCLEVVSFSVINCLNFTANFTFLIYKPWNFPFSAPRSMGFLTTFSLIEFGCVHLFDIDWTPDEFVLCHPVICLDKKYLVLKTMVMLPTVLSSQEKKMDLWSYTSSQWMQFS